MTKSRPLTNGELKGLIGTHPDRGVAEILRLREALRKAGETCEAARKIAEAALEIWPKLDEFPGTMR